MFKRILLIDTLSLLHQLKYSIGKGRLTKADEKTFIIYGFLFKLNALIKKSKANVIVWGLDSKTSLRKQIYAQYKENRSYVNKTEEQKRLDALAYPQFDEIINYVLPTLGCMNMFGEDGFESDDIIGRICKSYSDNQIVICTTDHDLYQIITNNICILNAKTDAFFSITDFENKYNIEPKMWKRIKAIGGCFDKKTEILTDRGWIQFPSIKKSDKVYSMDPLSRNASYEKITKRIKYIYKGEMYKIKGRLIDFVVTPNHKFFGSTTQAYPTKKSKSIITFKEIQEIVKYKNFTIPLTSDWNGIKKDKFLLPEITIQWETNCKIRGKFISTRKFDPVEIDMDIWLSFLGIYLADGHVSKNRNGNIGTIGISACKKRKLDFFTPILFATPWNWCRGKKGWRTDNVQLAEYLNQLGKAKEKYIPREFLNLSREQLQILFNSLISGDGCVSIEEYNVFGKEGITERISYFSSSKKLIDDVQEIAIKLGHATKIIKRDGREWNIRGKSGVSSTNYHLKINKSKNANIMKKTITKIPFNDFVYDITTEPHHTILIRRNGTVAWSSNCVSDNVKGVPIPQSDPTKKQRHVAEKGALNYITGKMKPTTQAYKAIESRRGKDVINRNKALVILPFRGTPKYSIRPDRLKKKGLIRIAEKYNFKAILSDIDFWCKSLKLR